MLCRHVPALGIPHGNRQTGVIHRECYNAVAPETAADCHKIVLAILLRAGIYGIFQEIAEQHGKIALPDTDFLGERKLRAELRPLIRCKMRKISQNGIGCHILAESNRLIETVYFAELVDVAAQPLLVPIVRDGLENRDVMTQIVLGLSRVADTLAQVVVFHNLHGERLIHRANLKQLIVLQDHSYNHVVNQERGRIDCEKIQHIGQMGCAFQRAARMIQILHPEEIKGRRNQPAVFPDRTLPLLAQNGNDILVDCEAEGNENDNNGKHDGYGRRPAVTAIRELAVPFDFDVFAGERSETADCVEHKKDKEQLSDMILDCNQKKRNQNNRLHDFNKRADSDIVHDSRSGIGERNPADPHQSKADRREFLRASRAVTEH